MSATESKVDIEPKPTPTPLSVLSKNKIIARIGLILLAVLILKKELQARHLEFWEQY